VAGYSLGWSERSERNPRKEVKIRREPAERATEVGSAKLIPEFRVLDGILFGVARFAGFGAVGAEFLGFRFAPPQAKFCHPLRGFRREGSKGYFY
jgi:hypothetical protein